ncbi:aldo/keto reductase [Candidatus Roizmanbacteria bacterium]|nr:aldo/keto reductase [Candidatus Roizmanbacteria bacterium]
MKYTTLGKTKLRVSRIGFGGWGIGGKDMWEINEEQSKQSLLKAYQNGINFFDTALYYGNGYGEKIMGQTLKDKHIIIATKVPPFDDQWPTINKDIDKVFPKDYIVEKAKESFKNLGNRTIDLLQLHVWLDDWFESNSWREAFTILKKEKIARFFGVSINRHDPHSALKLVNSGEIDTIQVIYNIFDQSPKDKLLPLAKKKGIGIIARVPLDEGSLSGTFTNATTFNDWRKDYFTPERLKLVVNKVDQIKNELATPDRTMTQIALKFCIDDNAADVVIVGMRNPKHVDENVKSVDIVLNKKEIKYLENQRWIRNYYD